MTILVAFLIFVLLACAWYWFLLTVNSRARKAFMPSEEYRLDRRLRDIWRHEISIVERHYETTDGKPSALSDEQIDLLLPEPLRSHHYKVVVDDPKSAPKKWRLGNDGEIIELED